MYIHERSDWPHFTWREQNLTIPLADVRHRQGRLIGKMESLGFRIRGDASFRFLVEDVLKTSEIEGDRLNIDQVRSSLARRLGLDFGALPPADRHVDGVVDMILDATVHHENPLTAERLWGWQAGLFPTGWSSLNRIEVGAWRTGPMQVISGNFGQERVHFEAPLATRVIAEMDRFLDWFNNGEAVEPVLKAALAHVWFVTIHPFDDGNGRIARAIADLSLARSEGLTQRFYSMSAQIRQERDAYYQLLEFTQKGELDVTEWLIWFFKCLARAIDAAEATLESVVNKAHFWERLALIPLNERQIAVLNRLYDGFEGKLTTSKWAKLMKISQDSALRDITELIELGILAKDPVGGRSASYSLIETS